MGWSSFSSAREDPGWIQRVGSQVLGRAKWAADVCEAHELSISWVFGGRVMVVVGDASLAQGLVVEAGFGDVIGISRLGEVGARGMGGEGP